MQTNLPSQTAPDARPQKNIQAMKLNENSRSSDLLPQKLLINNAVLSPPSTASKQNFTANKVLPSNHSYLREFLKQHSNKSQKNFNLTERPKIGQNNQIIDDAAQMKESAERTKILEYVRSATANTNCNPRRNASMGLSKLKQSQKLNPEVDVLY